MKEMLEQISLLQSEIASIRTKIRVLIEASNLSQKEKAVLRRRHVRKETYEQVGKSLGVTRERIRQIESKAIERMTKDEELDR